MYPASRHYDYCSLFVNTFCAQFQVAKVRKDQRDVDQLQPVVGKSTEDGWHRVQEAHRSSNRDEERFGLYLQEDSSGQEQIEPTIPAGV